jgi:hypothetical protein
MQFLSQTCHHAALDPCKDTSLLLKAAVNTLSHPGNAQVLDTCPGLVTCAMRMHSSTESSITQCLRKVYASGPFGKALEGTPDKQRQDPTVLSKPKSRPGAASTYSTVVTLTGSTH